MPTELKISLRKYRDSTVIIVYIDGFVKSWFMPLCGEKLTSCQVQILMAPGISSGATKNPVNPVNRV